VRSSPGLCGLGRVARPRWPIDSFGARVCRWETVEGVRTQVVYDRDGNEDTRMPWLGSHGDGE